MPPRHRKSNLGRLTVDGRRAARKRKLERLRNQFLTPQRQKANRRILELCELCGLSFPSLLNLNQHLRSAHQVEPYHTVEINVDDEDSASHSISNLDNRPSTANKNYNLNIHGCIFEKRFGAERARQMLENLLDEVANNERTKMKILDKDYNFVVSIVTPFMLRVHEKLKQSSEIVFMNSTGPSDLLGCKVLLLMTNSFSGRLPLAVIVTTLETTEAITQGLQMVLELLSEASFGGRGKKGPILFLIKEYSEALNTALLKVLPSTRVLFCQYQTVASMRNHIAKRSGDVHPTHKCMLLDMFKSLVYENDVKVFKKKVKEILYSDVALLYPLFREYLLEVLRTEMYWAACHRADIITRGQTTTSVCSTSMKVFKDSMWGGIPASPVHLLKIITGNYEKYYIDKLIQIAHHRVSSYLLSKWARVQRKCDKFVYFGDVRKVFDPDRNQLYVIDTELDLCSCNEGTNGKVCEHLYLALRNKDTGMLLTFPQTKSERKNCFYVATGQYLSDESLVDWFKTPLHPRPSFQPRVTNKVAKISKNAGTSADSLRPYEDDNFIEETIFVNVNIDSDDVDEEFSHGRTFKQLDNMFADLKTKIFGNPCLCVAAEEMVSSYKKIGTSDALESAILCFARNITNHKNRAHCNGAIIRKLQVL